MNDLFALLLALSTLAAIPFFVHETVRRRQALRIGDIRYRRQVLPFWINKKWTDNYKISLNFTNKAFSDFASEKLIFFPIVAVSYTAIGFFLSWAIFGNGSFLSLPVLPVFPDGFIGGALRLLTVILLVSMIRYYKEIYWLQEEFFDDYTIASAIVIPLSLIIVVLWADAGVLFFFAWLILALGSPLAMLVASVLVVASTVVEFTGIQMLLLYLIVVSGLNYLTASENQLRNMIALSCVFVGGLYAMFIGVQSLIDQGAVQLILQKMSFLLGQLEIYSVAILILMIGFYVLIFWRSLKARILLTSVVMLLPLVLMFVAYSILALSEKAFPNDDLCYPFSRELLGAVAVVILIPFVNSLFDFLSFGLTKLMLEFHQYISASFDKPRILLASLLISDVLITYLLIGGLVFSLFMTISWYENFIRLESCPSTTGADSVLKGITESGNWWLVFVISTTVFWSICHVTIVIIATFKYRTPDSQRLVALKHLSSKNQDQVMDDNIATWHADAIVKAAGVAILLGALIIYVLYQLPVGDFMPWVLEVTAREMSKN